jgi:hypothetical protein
MLPPSAMGYSLNRRSSEKANTGQLIRTVPAHASSANMRSAIWSRLRPEETVRQNHSTLPAAQVTGHFCERNNFDGQRSGSPGRSMIPLIVLKAALRHNVNTPINLCR